MIRLLIALTTLALITLGCGSRSGSDEHETGDRSGAPWLERNQSSDDGSGDEESGEDAGQRSEAAELEVITIGEEDAPVTVDLYYDYMCPACGAIEQTHGEDLSALLEDGTARINLRVMNFLDSYSQGTDYSTRAGNALVTVAHEQPEWVWEFHQALFAHQPSEGTSGLSDDELVEIATDVGVSEEVAARFADLDYDDWVAASDDAATEDRVMSTPTVRIDGEEFTGDWGNAGVVRRAIEAAAR